MRVNYKPVLIGGPIAPDDSVLDRILDSSDRDGLPPVTLRVAELRPIDFNDLAANVPAPMAVCVYRLSRVAGATAFYEFVRTETEPPIEYPTPFGL